jgi:AraC-like DNA-binding protein
VGSKNTLKITPHPTIGGLTLFSAPPDLHQHDRHGHASLAFIMLTEGEKNYFLEKKKINVRAGQIAVANPGEVHGCEYIRDTPWAHRTWYLSAELLAMLSIENGFRRAVEIAAPVIDAGPLSRFLFEQHRACADGNELDREAAAIEAISLLLNAHGAEPPQTERLIASAARTRVARYVEIISACAGSTVSLALLAEHAGVGRFQVIRDFKQVMGMSPGDYLRYVRLAHARLALRQGHSMLDAALGAGYSDQSHFSRVFKRVFGYSPSHFVSATQNAALLLKPKADEGSLPSA